jgi:hypothetical protein
MSRLTFIPCFEVQYGASPGNPTCPATLEIFTIDPACAISFSCARRQLKTPTKLMLMTFMNSSSLNSSIGLIATCEIPARCQCPTNLVLQISQDPKGANSSARAVKLRVPALLTHPFNSPNSNLTSSIHLLTSSDLDTSTTVFLTLISGKSLKMPSSAFSRSFSRTSEMQTVAPRAARYLAVARPIPLAPPVIVITLPANGFKEGHIAWLVLCLRRGKYQIVAVVGDFLEIVRRAPPIEDRNTCDMMKTKKRKGKSVGEMQ